MLGGAVLAEWQAGLDDLFALVAGRFGRVEPRRLAFAYIRGLLAPLERRNGWTIAEHAGRRSPNAVQEMLYSPCWKPVRMCRSHRPPSARTRFWKSSATDTGVFLS